MAQPIAHIDLGLPPNTVEAQAVLSELRRVSDVLFQEVRRVSFRGEEVAAVERFGHVDRLVLFRCPRGYVLYVEDQIAPNWAVAAETPSDLVDRVQEPDLNRRVRDLLQTVRLIE